MEERKRRYLATEAGRENTKRAQKNWAINNRERRNAYMRRWWAAHPDKRAAQCKRLRNKKLSDPIGYLIRRAKDRAKQKNLEFNLTPADFPSLPTHCPVFGFELCYSNTKLLFNSPTLDRINNNLGYVPSNVIIVSWRANRIKVDATPDELLCVGNFYKARI